jgi:phospholipid-binding lipoprotein MlaA
MNVILDLARWSRRLAVVLAVVLLAGCASPSEVQTDYTPPRRMFPELENKPIESLAILGVYDPWEGFNRSMYNFNTRFDRYVFLPAVSAYEFVTPNVVQKGIHNFFDNIDEITNLANNLLQGKLAASGVTVGRFVINSTVGILGLWDPATKMGLNRRPEDFGQTLGHWGVGAGPYLVLPVLGPSTLRDTGGLTFDYLVESEFESALLDNSPEEDVIHPVLDVLEILDERASNKFRYYETGSPFEYSLVRFAYTEMRKVQIEK